MSTNFNHKFLCIVHLFVALVPLIFDYTHLTEVWSCVFCPLMLMPFCFEKSAGNANRSFLARLRRRRTRCHDIDRARVTYCPWRKLCEWPHLRGRITLYTVNQAPYVCLVHMLSGLACQSSRPSPCRFSRHIVSVGRQRSGYLGSSLQWKIISVNYRANCWM